MTKTDGDSNGRITRRRILAGLGLLGGGLVVGGLGWEAIREPPSFTLGGTLPLTGQRSGIGEPLRRGLRLWQERVNADGGLRGRSVTLDVQDDEGDPDLARSTFMERLDRWDVAAAPYGSRGTAAIIDPVEEAGVPCVAHTAGDRTLWQAGRTWTVQLLNPIDTFLHPVVGIGHGAGARSMALVHRDDPFTAETMDGAVDEAERRGMTVLTKVTYDTGGAIPGAMEEALADEPDLLLGSGFQPGTGLGGFLPDAVALSEAYHESSGVAKLACWSIAGSFPRYREIRGSAADHETGVTGWKPYLVVPGNESFNQAYRDRWDSSPDSHAAQGFATGQLFADACRLASSVEPTDIRDALFELEVDTVFGRYRVDERGLQVGKTNAMVQWQAGTPVVVAPNRWATGDLVYPMGTG